MYLPGLEECCEC